MIQLGLTGEPGTAAFSPCGRYRYRLTRTWGPGGRTLNVIGLNCSTATAEVDDPTIRRCFGFACDWGFDRLVMTNVFAYRATDPRVMKRAEDPVGPENDAYLLAAAMEAQMVLAAWSAHAAHRGRERQVAALLSGVELWCLGTTRAGHPRHPLYMARATVPELWRGQSLHDDDHASHGDRPEAVHSAGLPLRDLQA